MRANNIPTLTGDPEWPPDLQIRDTLLEEANQLSVWTEGNPEKLPHRVLLAIAREIRRLRWLAGQAKCEPNASDQATASAKLNQHDR